MAIVNFIMSNYIVILIVVIILIFALIGRYVEKIGFFEPAADKQKNNVNKVTEEKKEPEPTVEPQAPKEEVNVTMVPKQEETKNVSIEDIDNALFAPIEGKNEYDELNKEVKSLLSKKEVIDDDLLSDIDNLSLDKTQKYNFGDIPDLDDVDLPEIKKADDEEDIWKF